MAHPWFVLSDLAKVMEIKNTTILKKRLEQAGLCQAKVEDARGNKVQQLIVNKDNMYRVTMRSDKPEAVKFQNWVTDVVLFDVKSHFEGQNVRTVIINDEPWFVLGDVCKVLEIETVSRTKDRFDQQD